MKERQILFSGSMVRAILGGSKTQTRRVVKPQPDARTTEAFQGADGIWRFSYPTARAPVSHSDWDVRCPYGQPGNSEWRTGQIPSAGMYRVRGLLDESLGGDDRAVWVNPEYFTWGFSESDDPEAIQLDTDITPENIQWKRPGDQLWVREAWRAELTWDSLKPSEIPDEAALWYEADGKMRNNGLGSKFNGKLRHSMFMPRWASRITLEITGVRAERLHEITEDDAKAEGCLPVVHDDGTVDCGTRKTVYRALWESINGEGSWSINPWVWCVSFRRIHAS